MDRCIHCGKPEEDHCPGFEKRAFRRPNGCVCDDDGSWAVDAIPPPCSTFKPWPDMPEYCQTCEHDRECHRSTP